MKLKDTLIGLDGLKAKGDLDVEITGIESNVERVQTGNVFVAIKGSETDGHDYINQAIESGAMAIMVEEGCDLKKIKLNAGVTLVMSPNTRRALAIMSSNFYDNPSKKFKLIGITGTRGKTTTTFMIKEILEKAGKRVGLIEKNIPDCIELQRLFAQMADEKVEYVIIGVSSESLKSHRVDGCDFDIVAFTNLSEDYMSKEEYANIQEYFDTKLKLFKMCKIGFTNEDDFYGAKIPNLFPENDIITYGIDNFAKVMARDIMVANSYADFKMKINGQNERIKVGIPGRFSIYNALLAIAITQKLDINPNIIKKALENIKVPGRSEIVDNNRDITIMIDCADNPKSLETVLQTAKKYTLGRIICVLGCEGDTSTRTIMCEISNKIADYTILTTDNPQSGNSEKIIKDIKEAIKMAHKKDMIIIAGKGNEKYLSDERKILKNILN